MTKQLNIRSDRAYDVAHGLARRLGKTVTQVLEDALASYQEQVEAAPLTPEQQAFVDEVLLLSERAAAAKQAGASSDHRDYYDERGLPA